MPKPIDGAPKRKTSLWRKVFRGVGAVLLAALVACAAFPFFDTRVPFRFERFAGPLWFIASWDDVEGANKTFLQHFPIGTPTSDVEAYFHKAGGRCSTFPLDRPGKLFCSYKHAMFPWICIVQVWAVTMAFDAATQRITAAEVRSEADGC